MTASPLPPRPTMRPIPDGDLQASTGRIIRAGAAALEIGRNWAEDTAHVVLSQPAIRDALNALDLVKTMRAEHRPVPRRPGSHDLVCAACGTGWRCTYADRLGVPA